MEHMPVFVKLEEQDIIKKSITSLKNRLNGVKTTLSNIVSLSQEESSKIKEWKENSDSINDRISKINRALLEPEEI